MAYVIRQILYGVSSNKKDKLNVKVMFCRTNCHQRISIKTVFIHRAMGGQLWWALAPLTTCHSSLVG